MQNLAVAVGLISSLVSLVSSTCLCQNGQPITNTADLHYSACLQTPGLIGCHPRQCDAGFHAVEVPYFFGLVDIDFTYSCTENICSCQNGQVNFCPATGVVHCDTCDPFYHLESSSSNSSDSEVELSTCVANQCSCANGIPVNNNSCLQHQANQCQICDSNYHLDDNQNCVPNVCQCDNGNAVGFENCESDGNFNCATCDPLHHVVSDSLTGISTCESNICTCENGIAATSNCFNHEQRCEQN